MSTDKKEVLRGDSTWQSATAFYSDGAIHKLVENQAGHDFRDARGSPEQYSSHLPELKLPGYGQQLPKCASTITRTCELHPGQKFEKSGFVPGRNECPYCWPVAVRDHAQSLAEKLMGFRSHRDIGNTGSIRLHEVVVSLPEDFAVNSKKPLTHTVDLVQRLLETAGVDNGIIIYHPYRQTSTKSWKQIMDLSPDERQEHITDSPHFHAFCVSNYVETKWTRELERETGLVVKRITEKDRKADGNPAEKYDEKYLNMSISDNRQLLVRLEYALAHAGLMSKQSRDQRAVFTRGQLQRFSTDQLPARVRRTVEMRARGFAHQVAPSIIGLPEDTAFAGNTGHVKTQSEKEYGQTIEERSRLDTSPGGETREWSTLSSSDTGSSSRKSTATTDDKQLGVGDDDTLDEKDEEKPTQHDGEGKDTSTGPDSQVTATTKHTSDSECGPNCSGYMIPVYTLADEILEGEFPSEQNEKLHQHLKEDISNNDFLREKLDVRLDSDEEE